MLSESQIDLPMLSQIGADQMREGSLEKSWFGKANRLHCTTYPSWTRFLGSRTNFVRARTISRHGPSTGESLVQHGWGKVVYTTKSILVEAIFLVFVFFFHPSRAIIFRQCKWGLRYSVEREKIRSVGRIVKSWTGHMCKSSQSNSRI